MDGECSNYIRLAGNQSYRNAKFGVYLVTQIS
jgi:hypothetical protein